MCRVLEQEKGLYQFAKMQRDAPKLFPPVLNVATYAIPVAVKSAGPHGKGLFTTTAVKAGDLLLCEKALAFAPVFLDPSSSSSPSLSIFVNAAGARSMGKQVDVIGVMVRKVQNNPALLAVFTNLYHGSYETTGVTMVDGAPVVDT